MLIVTLFTWYTSTSSDRLLNNNNLGNSHDDTFQVQNNDSESYEQNISILVYVYFL